MDYWLNDSMKACWDWTEPIPSVDSLSAEHQRVLKAGLLTSDGRVFLREYVQRLLTAPPDDACGDEQWTNDVHLESTFPSGDPVWRRQVVGQGLALARELVPKAQALSKKHVAQVVISLQSSPNRIDPDRDFAVGNLKLFLVRSDSDDWRLISEGVEQPILVVTAGEAEDGLERRDVVPHDIR